jgi:hypothetical protein
MYRPHKYRTPIKRSMWLLCAPIWTRSPTGLRRPLRGLLPPFPTSPPSQGDPEAEVGNGSSKWWCRQAGQRAGEKPPGHQPTPHGSPEVSPPHPHILTLPSRPPGWWSPQHAKHGRRNPATNESQGPVALRGSRHDCQTSLLTHAQRPDEADRNRREPIDQLAGHPPRAGVIRCGGTRPAHVR